MSKIEKQKEHFESIAARYVSAREDIRHLAVKSAIWSSFFSIFNNRAAHVEVLEAMCGVADGYDILKANFTSFTFDAFDYSPKMVQFAKERLPKENIFEGDVCTFTTEKKYDIILVIGGLHHVHDFANIALENLKLALKDNGFLIIFEPVHNNFFYKKVREFLYKKNSLFDETTERGFTTSELDNMMENAGLALHTQIHPGLLAYVLWFNPDAFPLLNKGGLWLVNNILALEKKIYNTRFARYFSFATIGAYQKISG